MKIPNCFGLAINLLLHQLDHPTIQELTRNCITVLADLFQRIAFLDFPVEKLVFSDRLEQFCGWMKFESGAGTQKRFALADANELKDLGESCCLQMCNIRIILRFFSVDLFLTINVKPNIDVCNDEDDPMGDANNEEDRRSLDCIQDLLSANYAKDSI